jgi:indolepyruvate ferredoxin oxidoreductase, alpha subunit
MKIVAIDQDICTGCNICIEQFSCPSFQREQDNSITINRELCNNNGSCIQVCPHQAIVRINTDEQKST